MLRRVCGVTLVVLIRMQPLLLAAADHTGQVTFDGAPVPGVTVIASQGDRRMTTSTNAEGVYRFRQLEDGTWTVRVEMRGFAPETRTVTVAPDQTARAPWELSLQSYAEITRGGSQTARLPVGQAAPANARATRPVAAPQSAQTGPAQLRPSQLQTPQAAARPAGAAEAAAAPPVEEVPVNPLFGAADSFLVNGSVMNAAASPYSQSRALGNLRILPAGRQPYSFTGTIGGRSAALDARPFGVSARPNNYNLNFSGTVGGPLRIPWLIRQGPAFTLMFNRSDAYDVRSSSLQLPTRDERNGDFSQSVDGFGNAVIVRDPVTGLPFANNAIPADRLSPQALALLAHYPQATGAGALGGNFQATTLTAAHNDAVSFRLNPISLQPQTQIDNISAGYSRGVNNTTAPFGFEDRGHSRGVSAGVGVTHRLSPFMLLRARTSFNRNVSQLDPYFANRLNVSGAAGIVGNNQSPENWGPPALSFRTIAGLSTADHSDNTGSGHLSGAELNWSYRRHALLFGGEVERRRTDVVTQQNPRGSFFFSGDQTGSDFADFLLGLPRTSAIAFGNADKYFRQTTYAAFVTDDVRLSPSFTMNLGVRWEYEAPVVESQNRLVNLDVAQDFASVNPVLANKPNGALTGRAYPRSLVRPDKTLIQPRVALAWRPLLGSSVIVRAGYGIYRNTNVYESIAMRMAQQPPLSVAVSAERTAATPITLENGFIASPGIVQVPWAIDPEFRMGYAHNWQAMIQRDFPWSLQISATYVGVKGSRLPQVFLPNTYAPGSVNPCPACPIGFQYLTSGGSSRAHRGQVQVRRRLANGFDASGQYTLATGRDNASTFTGISGTPAQNWRDLEAEWGSSALIRRHEFGGQFRYTSTVDSGARDLRSTLLRSWTASSTVSVGSGYPLTPVYASAIPGTTISAAVRPSLTGESLDAIPDGLYLNPLAFGAPAAGEWGTAPRGSIRGPSSFSLNGTIARSFQVNPRASMTWQMSVSNLLNRATRTGLNTFVGSPQFGQPVAFVAPRRINVQLQVGFR